MKKNYLSLVFVLLCYSISFGQVKIAEVNFEVPGGYTTNIAEFTNGTNDCFIRTDGSDITSEEFTNIQGTYYFAAEDIDSDGTNTLPLTLNLDDIDIAGYENLQFRVHIAEDDEGTNQDWDNSDYVHFNYDIDNSGTFTNLLWIENDGSAPDSAPFIDTDFDETGDGAEITDSFNQYSQTIVGTGDLMDIEIEFSLDGDEVDIAIDNIEIWGTYIANTGTTTWDGTAWNPVIPDINTSAIIDGPYDTGFNGNIDANDLTINLGNTLRVADNSYINIKNEITTNGDIIVETDGSVVQKNDASVNATTGTVTLQKETSMLTSSLDYTYWSSPVSDETIESVFAVVPVNRRFYFDANNFEDIQAEVGNTGVYNPGQDDIDDNANAWQLATGAMTPGVGYAATPGLPGPFGFPEQQVFIFEGTLNNGLIQPAIVNNSGGVYNDWNFIGNPYPSAIDAYKFFSTNAGIVDALYLWSQASPLDPNNPGNQGFNFSTDDYAVLSASGVNVAGGSGDIPDNYIPSGQGFFIEALGGTNVTFNNAMRDTGNNTQFFRNTNISSNDRDVLWLNLTSDNGVFNQIAVAHLTSASDSNDGSFYDVKRNASALSYARIYSQIQNTDGEFVIQGRSKSSLNIDEIISLGFNNSIDSPTIFTISIAQFEGAFHTNNDIYLVDNLLNTIHNLKESDYSFTSEVGVFNDRFDVVFNAQVLSIDDNTIDNNQLIISELNNGNVKFSINANYQIESVEIIDLIGRTIYNLKGEYSTEIYNLDNLNKSAYIARVTLSNGQVITKKAIKRL